MTRGTTCDPFEGFSSARSTKEGQLEGTRKFGRLLVLPNCLAKLSFVHKHLGHKAVDSGDVLLPLADFHELVHRLVRHVQLKA